MDTMDRMLELSRQGFYCAQILMILALESEGKEDPDLVRAIGGLNGGIGNSRNLCGTMTGGACFLSYFGGKGEPDELEHPELNQMIQEYLDWFRKYTREYGGCTCNWILSGDTRNMIQRCPVLMQAAVEKCVELLQQHGVVE